MKKKIISCLLSCMVMITMMSGLTISSFADTTVDYQTALDKAVDYISVSFGKNPNYGNEWQAFVSGLSKKVTAETRKKYYENYGANLAAADGILKRDMSHVEYVRGILALVALGCDPTDVAGYNLIGKLNDTDKVISQGVNAPTFALIALNCNDVGMQYEEAKKAYIDSLINKYKLNDGGWAFGKNSSSVGAVADVDMTSMAVQALAPYYKTDTKVKDAIDDALKILKKAQTTSGEFKSSGYENAESLSQVIVAFTSLGKNPVEELNVNPIKTLISYQTTTGAFEHIKGKGANGLATSQSTYALIAYDKYIKGEKTLYDMTDNTLKPIDIPPMRWAKIIFSKASYTYNGYKPTLIITYAGKKKTGYTVSGLTSAAGKHCVKVTGNGTTFTGSVSLPYTISKANQKLTASKSVWYKNYGNSPFALGVKRTVGDGKITYKSSNIGIATVSSTGTITIKSTGAVTITATAASTSNYNKATKSIKIYVQPKRNVITGLYGAKGAITVKWAKDYRATGYQIQYAKNYTFTKSKKQITVSGYNYSSKKISKLVRNTRYYVRVRAYKFSGGKYLYGNWSNIKSIKTK